MICTTCNWTRHDVSIHGQLCRNGHPIEVVGRYNDGHCKECQRSAARKYDSLHREENRARWRAWYWRTHVSPETAPRDNGANTGGRSVAGPGAARSASGAAPTTKES